MIKLECGQEPLKLIKPDGLPRVETGPVQIGEDDWPGMFLRGDNALYYAHMLKSIADKLQDVDMVNSFDISYLRGIASVLEQCKVKPSK